MALAWVWLAVGMAVIFIAFVAFIAVGFVRTRQAFRANNMTPEQTLPAKITGRRAAPPFADSPYGMNYYVQFEIAVPVEHRPGGGKDSKGPAAFPEATGAGEKQNGNSNHQPEFTVPEAVYNTMTPGMTGRLTTKGKRFISFDPEKEL